jgi:hypothetical protein
MIEQWYVLTLEPGPRPALVLDASESAQKLAPYLRSLVEGVIELMPESSRPRLYFLGNPKPYETADFAANGERWFTENSARGSFIGPVFEALEAEPDVAVAIAGAGRIFDLPDWHGHALADHAVWMKVGPTGLTDGAYKEETYACEQLAEMLNNPLSHVEIFGPGAMPIAWDDPAFRLDGQRLVGEKTSGSLRFGILGLATNPVSASVVMANGSRRELRLEPGESIAPAAWSKLPHGEFMLLRQCLNKAHFQCPLCQHEHPAGVYRCPANKDVPLFPTLEVLPKGGFALIDTGTWEARVRPHPLPVLQLSSESVAVRDANGATLREFDLATNSWRPLGRFTLFHLLQDKLYAMVV